MNRSFVLPAAVLALGLLPGVHAQTINGVDSNGATLFTVDLNQSSVIASPQAYTYNYVATLDSVAKPGVGVNTFTFNFGAGVPVDYVSSPGFTEASVTPGAFSFGSPVGLTNVGDQATFTFSSPLPPTGSVSAAATSPALAGGGTTSFGPGVAAVPEPSALALLGLGALPLAAIARRRRSSTKL